MDYTKEIDWEVIAKQLSVLENARILIGSLSQYDYYSEKAFANAASKSLAGDIQNILTTELRRHFETRCQTIYSIAVQHGLTFEEAFVRLATNKSLNNLRDK